MNKLALAVSISVISGSAMATVTQTEVDFNGYDVETFARRITNQLFYNLITLQALL